MGCRGRNKILEFRSTKRCRLMCLMQTWFGLVFAWVWISIRSGFRVRVSVMDRVRVRVKV